MKISEDRTTVSGGSGSKQGILERRIQVDAQGNKVSGVFGGINNHDTFKGDCGIPGHNHQAAWPDGKSPSILDGIKGQFPTQAATTIFPQTTGQLSISQGLSYVPLTGMQRLTELKKKITEYKSLLTVINDATAKSFVTLLLSNIEKELGEIQVELNRNPVTAPAITPVNPGFKPYDPNQPFGPIDYPSPPFVAPIFPASPGIAWPLDQTYPKIGDFPNHGYSVTCKTDSSLLSQNNIEGL